ncbi:MAG: glycosyltransferase family 4 protein [Vicinamibacteria bacterium]
MTERRRIGYVLSQFPCYDETFILREIRALAARGVEVTIFSLRRKPQAVVQEDALELLPQTRYSTYLGPKPLFALASALFRSKAPLLSLVRRLAGDLWRRPLTLAKSLLFLPKTLHFADVARRARIERLHAHWATHPATAALLMSEMTGIPWSFTCHAHDIFRDPILLTHKLQSASFALTCTAHNKSYLDQLANGSASRVRVSYHGLDLGLFRPPEGRPAKARVEILAVGSLLPCKGFRYLLEACRQLRDRGVDCHTTIAGGGPEEESLRKLSSELGIEREVDLTGYVTQRDLVPLYRRADVFVLPAVAEMHWGIPNVLVEALACGLPVVTTPLPSVPELVEDGVSGILIEDGDARTLADCIERLARSPELRRDMGRRGRESVERKFDIERTIETVIEPLLGGAP